MCIRVESICIRAIKVYQQCIYIYISAIYLIIRAKCVYIRAKHVSKLMYHSDILIYKILYQTPSQFNLSFPSWFFIKAKESCKKDLAILYQSGKISFLPLSLKFLNLNSFFLLCIKAKFFNFIYLFLVLIFNLTSFSYSPYFS